MFLPTYLLPPQASGIGQLEKVRTKKTFLPNLPAQVS